MGTEPGGGKIRYMFQLFPMGAPRLQWALNQLLLFIQSAGSYTQKGKEKGVGEGVFLKVCAELRKYTGHCDSFTVVRHPSTRSDSRNRVPGMTFFYVV